MSKIIEIRRDKYTIQYGEGTAYAVLDKVIEWMIKHPASTCGEGIMQSDDCQTYAADLIADIVDDILIPELIEEQ